MAYPANLVCTPIGPETQGLSSGLPSWSCHGGTPDAPTFFTVAPLDDNYCDLVNRGYIPDVLGGACAQAHYDQYGRVILPAGTKAPAPVGYSQPSTAVPGSSPVATQTSVINPASGSPVSLGSLTQPGSGDISPVVTGVSEPGGGGVVSPGGGAAQNVPDAIQSASGGMTSGTADDWCFYYAQVTGQACPAPEEFGFVGDCRFTRVSFTAWWSALQARLAGSAIPNPCRAGAAGGGGAPSPAPSGGAMSNKNLLILAAIAFVVWYTW